MIEYNIVYALIWLLALVSLKKNAHPSLFLYVLQVIVLSLMVGLKFQTGYDWPAYEAHYNALATSQTYYLRFEFGYEFLASSAAWLGLSFVSFSSVISVCEIIFVAIAVRGFFPRYSMVILAVMYSVPDFYLIPTFSLLRQGLAVSVFFLGMLAFYKNRKGLGCLLLILAVSVHFSVLGSIALLIAVRVVPVNRVAASLLFCVSLILFVAGIDVIRGMLEILVHYLDPKYAIYLARDVFNASLAYRLAFAFISTIVFTCIYYSWRAADQERASGAAPHMNHMIIKLGMLSLLIPLVMFGFPTISTRYQYFFSIFLLGVALHTLSCFTYRSRVLIIMCMITFCYVPFYRFLSSPLSVVYVPYQSIFFYDQNNSTGQERTNNLLKQLDVLWSK